MIQWQEKYIYFNFLILECLVSGDVINTMKRITKYYNHLRDLLPCNDVSVMEIAARTLVKLANLPGSKGAESFEFDIKRAFEWLSGDRHEVFIGGNKSLNFINYFFCCIFSIVAMLPFLYCVN